MALKDSSPPTSGSRDQAKRWFRSNGISISEWAIARGFNRDQVYAVLGGRNIGTRGTAHRIAVALGIKEQSDVEAEDLSEGAPGQ